MARKSQVRELDDVQLYERLAEHKQELFNLRFQHVTGQLDNYARINQIKREVARCNTELRMREIAAAERLDAVEQDETSEQPPAPAETAAPTEGAE